MVFEEAASFSNLQNTQRIKNMKHLLYTFQVLSVTHHRDLVGLISGSNPQLVDGRLGDVGSLLCIVQLMLDFPETHRAAAHLLLLLDKQRNNSFI